jgi:transposase
LACDEIAIGKGHNYPTVVLDLFSGAVVLSTTARKLRSWRQLRRARAKIKAVATDMGRPYIRVVLDNLPKAIHIFDHFHVTNLFNDRLSALRRELYHQARTDLERRVLISD